MTVNYSRGDYTVPPVSAGDLETIYSAGDLTAVATDDGSYVSQTASGEFPIHEFKNVTTATNVDVVWDGRSNYNCSTYPVVLQVYNVSTTVWEELDRDDTTGANTDFTLSGNIPVSTNYRDGSDIVTCRVYQDYAYGYTIKDEFITAIAAGSGSSNVNGTAAEPGPGTRTTVETGFNPDYDLSISGGKLVMGYADATTSTTSYITYGSVTRAAGAILRVDSEADNNASDGRNYIGFFKATPPTSVNVVDASIFRDNQLGVIGDGGNSVNIYVSAYSINTISKWAVVLRAAGDFAFLYVSPYWELVYNNVYDSTSTLYLASIHKKTGTKVSIDCIRLSTYLWLPTPLISDSFTGTFPTTDGAGHAETSGLGAGGSGLSWVAAANTIWANSGGAASCSQLDAALTPNNGKAIYDCGKKDVVVNCIPVRSAGNVGVVFRYIDASNYMYAYSDGTNIAIHKVVSGTDTAVDSSASAYSAGAKLVVNTYGTNVKVFYNNVHAVTVTIPSPFNGATATQIGLYTTDTGNSFASFVAWARGTSGEYAILDTII